MIVVTGPTGQLGRRVVEGLLEKLPGARIGVSVRIWRRPPTLSNVASEFATAILQIPPVYPRPLTGGAGSHCFREQTRRRGPLAAWTRDPGGEIAGAKLIFYTNH